MTDTLWWIVGAYLIVATAILVANARSHAQENAVLRFQTSVGVELPQSLGEKLRERMLVSRRSQLVGGIVGLLVSALIVSSRTADPGALEVMILAAGAFAGPALAVSITSLFTPRIAADDHLRYARSQAVELSDYVPGTERWLARGPAVLAVLYFAAWGTGIGLGLIPKAGVASLISGVVLALIAIGSLAIFEVAGRRVVAMGNRVASEEELVWEDAIRSHTVRNISSAPALVGLYAIVSAVPVLIGRGDDSTFMGWIGLVAAGVVLVVVMITIILRPERHFLRKLWPELAAATGKPYGAEAEH